MDRNQKVGAVEDRDLAGHLMEGGTVVLSGAVDRTNDDEGGSPDALVLGQVLRVQRILDRCRMKAILPRDAAQLFARGMHQVDPGKRWIGTVDDGPNRHARQILLAAAAAPKP